MECWIAWGKSWKPVLGNPFSTLAMRHRLLRSSITPSRLVHRLFAFAGAVEAAVPPWSLLPHPYGLACATFSLQGKPLGSSEQKGFCAFGAFENEIGIESLPPNSVLTSCSSPSLPAMTIVPPSGDMSAVIGIALFWSGIPPVTALFTML